MIRIYMKKYIVWILLTMAGLLLAEPIARVGNYDIDSALLYERMNSYKNENSLEDAHKRAMQELIEEQLLIIYAQEQNIEISTEEVNAFFSDVFATHPRFSTDGQFDQRKFEAARNAPEIKKILNEMERELLIDKTRTILQNSFDIDDNNLLELFILDNAEIDIHYTIMDIDALNTTEPINRTEVEKFYHKHRYDYQSPEQVKLELLLVPYSAFADSAASRTKDLLEAELALSTDSLTAEQIDARGAEIFKQQQIAITSDVARELYLTQNRDHRFSTLTTPFLSEHDACGSIPSSVIQAAVVEKSSHFSRPIQRPDGFLLYRVIQSIPSHPLLMKDARFAVWKDFLQAQHQGRDSHLYRQYFMNHIDDFIVPAASVCIYPITEVSSFGFGAKRPSRAEIRQEVDRLLPNETAVETYMKNLGIEYQQKVLFLDKFTPKTMPERSVVTFIRQGDSSGIIPGKSTDWLFIVQSQLTNYLPSFEDISAFMPRYVPVVVADTTGYRDYYNARKRDFTTPDSVKIGGVFFPIVPDTITIQPREIQQYYNDNKNTMFREESVSFIPVFTRSLACANHIAGLPVTPENLVLIPALLDEGSPWDANQIYALENLPKQLQEVCIHTKDGETTQPAAYQDGWLVGLNLTHHKGGFLSRSDALEMIRRRLQRNKADDLALKKARSFFDSTRYYGQVETFADSAHRFVTPFQDASLSFGPIGSIGDIKQELLRIWHNEKYSSIVTRPDGYGVVFMLKRRTSKQLSFKDALGEIEKKFVEQRKIEQAKEFGIQLRDSIARGKDPDSTLYFIAPWQDAKNLKLGSEIPGLEYSRLILEDIINRDEGYVSPMLPLPGNRFFFYRIDRIRKVPVAEFEQSKEQYRTQLINQQYQHWLERYKSKFQIITG